MIGISAHGRYTRLAATTAVLGTTLFSVVADDPIRAILINHPNHCQRAEYEEVIQKIKPLTIPVGERGFRRQLSEGLARSRALKYLVHCFIN